MKMAMRVFIVVITVFVRFINLVILLKRETDMG